MRFGIRHWRARHIISAWGAYWASLAAITLGPGALALWRATQGTHGTSSVNASFGDGGFHLEVLRQGITTWTGSASLGAVMFWTCGPPLLLWLAWLVRRPGRGAPGAGALNVAAADAAPPALEAPNPGSGPPVTPHREPLKVRRDEGR